MAGGRPRTLTDERVAELVDSYIKYIEETDIPIVAEFAYLSDIPRQILYDYPEFSTLSKKAIDKKEMQLEKMGYSSKGNPAFIIFSLKQLGWRDKQELEHSGSLAVNLIVDIPKGKSNGSKT